MADTNPQEQIARILEGVDPMDRAAIEARLKKAGATGYESRLEAMGWQLAHLPQTLQARQQAQQSGRPVTIKFENSKITANPDGSVTSTTGSAVKPLIAAGALAGGYFLAPAIFGGGAAAVGGSGAASGAAGAGTAGATAGGTAAGAGAAGAATAGGLGPWGPIISAGIGTAGQIISGKMAANASDKATAAQSAAAKDSLDFLKEKQAAYEAALQPYLNAGRSGLGMLTSLLGLPAPATAASANARNPNFPNGVIGPYQATPSGQPSATGVDFVGGAGRPDATFGGTQAPAMGGPLSSMASGGPSASGFVQMRGPDGSVRAVPAALETYAAAKGAVRV